MADKKLVDPAEIKKMIADKMRRPVEDIEDKRTLKGDLNMDDLDLIELEMDIEDTWGFTLPNELPDMDDLTVEALIVLLQKLNGEG